MHKTSPSAQTNRCPLTPSRKAIVLSLFSVVVAGQIAAQTTETHRFLNLNRAIPDGNASGLSDHQMVSSAVASIASLRVKLHIEGEFNGDLYAYLRHVHAGRTNFCVLLNRVGRSLANPLGYADSGLDITLDDTSANGNIHTYQNLVTPPTGALLTGSWQPDGRDIDPFRVLAVDPSTSALSDFQGADPDGEWTLYVTDLDRGATHLLVSWELEILGGVVPDVSWPNPADLTYGIPLGPTQLNASATVDGHFAYDPPTGTVLNAGAAQPLSVTFTPADTGTYVPVTKTITLNILPAPLAIAAHPQSKVYGVSDPALTYSVSGLQGSDTAVGVLTGALGRAVGETVAGGAYAITQGTLAASANYAIHFTGNSLTITPASTTGLVSSSANPATPGRSVTLRLQVAPVAPGAGTPTGTVQFLVDGSTVGSPVAVTGGVASLSLTTLTAGTHTVAAAYAGDGNFIGTTNSLAGTQLVNTAPVATVDTVLRYPTDSAKVLVATLLANDSDADGNPIQLLTFTTTTANGGTITRGGDWLHYTPAAGFTNDDAFTYTIQDSHQARSTGTVTIHATSDAVPAPNLVLEHLGNGTILLKFDGIPGVTYRIQSAETLPDWQTLGSSTADETGMFEYIDAPPPASPMRLYRSVYP